MAGSGPGVGGLPTAQRRPRDLDRPVPGRPESRAFLDRHLVTFRVPELERWQHAAAAALVGARWGVAGLRTVIADTQAPLGRRPGSLRRKIVVADRAERALESPRIVAAVVVLVRVRHVR